MKTNNEKTNETQYTGEIVGYKSRLNFFSQNTVAKVKVDGKIRKITIDSRQMKLIQKEYPPGSMIKLGFNDKWYIISQPIVNHFKPQEDEMPFFDK